MITITMNTKRLKLTVDGHAQPEESAEYREICAAASALAQALAYTVSRYNGGEGTMKSIQYRPDPGNLLLKVFPETWAERAFQHIYNHYAEGMQLLAESHPQCITFIRDGERIGTKEET